MAPASADTADTADTSAADAAAAREARLAMKTDALCLKHMLARRGSHLFPLAIVLAYLAFKDGAGVWAIVWLLVWMTVRHSTFACRPGCKGSPKRLPRTHWRS